MRLLQLAFMILTGLNYDEADLQPFNPYPSNDLDFRHAHLLKVNLAIDQRC